jgi:hypothetical protein
MPNIAYRDGENMIPEDQDDGEDVLCPDCEGLLRVRGPFDDGRARHFFHADYQTRECPSKASGEGGGPAESEVHQQLKAQAVSSLREEFIGEYECCRPEVSIDVSETITDADTRRADVLLKFSDRNEFYGQGIIVEVQHLNAGKDIRATTHDYLESDFSVYWATVEDFSNEVFDLDRMNTAFSNRFEHAFSAYHDVPPALEAPDRLISPDDHRSHTTRDLVPECDHQYVANRGPARVCVKCGQELEWTFYHPSEEKIWASKHTIGLPESIEEFLAAKAASVNYPVEINSVEKLNDPLDHEHRWGRGVDITYGQKYHCSDCDATMIVSGDDITIDGDGQNSDFLR